MYDENKLRKLGLTMGKALRGGEVIELIGDVGAGKTTLTKAIAVGMGITEPIQSPTFTISNRYQLHDGPTLAHYDFYRLQDGGVMADELAETVGDMKVVTVIEWADVVRGVLPDDRLTIYIEAEDELRRHVAVEAHGPRAKHLKELLV